MSSGDEILIVGAGIGGLTAALSLHDAGFSVRIFMEVPGGDRVAILSDPQGAVFAVHSKT